MFSTASARRRFSPRAFTLIELLVVIVILGILMAVAVPTFLRQQAKAQDSRTQQYLTTAFKAIRSGLPDTGNVYPQSTSMVSWIQQSEPELTAQRGSCSTQVQAAPQDAVLVDPASTPTSLTLCARSQSGNVFKLTATNTGVQQLLDGTLIPLSFSGNEITDAARAAGVQGDGLSSDSSTGIWEGTTNLVANGGFETNTSGWVASTIGGTPSIGQYSSDKTFGSDSMRLLSGTTGTLNSARANQTFAASTTYTASAWIKVAAGAGATSIYFTAVYDSPQQSATANLIQDGQWHRYVVTFTTDTSAQTADYLDVRVSGGAIATQYDIRIDGVQLEQKPFATPYVETNGAVQTRPAAAVHVSSSLVNVNQGWAAARIRVGWDSAAGPASGFPQVFRWTGTNGTDTYALMWRQTTKTWEVDKRAIGGGWTDVDSAVQTFSAGTTFTVIGYWTASTVGVSVNGGNFVSLSDPVIPTTMAGQDIYFGSDPNYLNRQLDGDILWEAVGTGTLSNVDAVTINGWGNQDPKVASFPAGAQATMIWDGNSTSGSLK